MEKLKIFGVNFKLFKIWTFKGYFKGFTLIQLFFRSYVGLNTIRLYWVFKTYEFIFFKRFN